MSNPYQPQVIVDTKDLKPGESIEVNVDPKTGKTTIRRIPSVGCLPILLALALAAGLYLWANNMPAQPKAPPGNVTRNAKKAEKHEQTDPFAHEKTRYMLED
jgi:hypothetical protein